MSGLLRRREVFALLGGVAASGTLSLASCAQQGARWVIVRLAGVAGLASGLVAKLMPWSAAWPR